jgi:nucleoside-diphosphate-sugar epimerase
VQGTQTFYADPKDVIDVALRGIMNVLAACEDRAVAPELVLLSSSEVYQNPPEDMYPTGESVPLTVPDVTNPRYSYGGGKIASELALLAYQQAGMLGRAMIVRPHNIYGPDMGRDHVIPQFALRMTELIQARSKRPIEFPIQGTGKETRSFCYVSDCIDGLMTVFDHGADREIYHLGNPAEEYSIEQLAYEVADHYDVEIRVSPGELPEGSPKRRKPDIGKLEALGFKPKVSLGIGLAPTLRWYRDNYAPLAA